MHDENDEVYLLFLEESQEHLEDIESNLLELESQGSSPDENLLNKVFRAVHTVKGGAGFFGLTKVQTLSHAMENILGMVRSSDLTLNSQIISTLLEGADLLRRMVLQPEIIDSLDIQSPVAACHQIVNQSDSETTTSSEETVPICNPDGSVIFTVLKTDLISAQTVDGGGNYIYLIKYDLYKDIEDKNRTPQQVVKEYLQLTYFIDSFTDFSRLGTLDAPDNQGELPFYVLCATVMDPLIMGEFADLDSHNITLLYDKRIKHDTVDKNDSEAMLIEPIRTVSSFEEPSVIRPSEPIVREVIPTQKILSNSSESIVHPTTVEVATEKKNAKESTSSVRIQLSQLEQLMSLAGELVLIRNELLQKVMKVDSTEIRDAAQRVDTITSELQEAIMVTRMQSVGVVFSKFRRVVRDLSSALGKDVELTIEGEDVELDRSIVETIGDPLTHMIRNSIDHGIEMPSVRRANGKSESGLIKLKALHQAGQVIISLQDDGAGIDPDKVGRKAIEKGLITEEQFQSMSRKDLVRLVFRPGFSTVETVTDLSGRGVGMDVVLSSFTKVGGVVDIDSEVGIGTQITIKLPLTLAIIPSLLIKVGQERFAIPQVNLEELVRIRPEKVQERLEWVGNAAVLRLRGKLLPLVRLSELFGMDNLFVHPETGEAAPCRRTNIADRRSPEIGTIAEKRSGRSGRRSSFTSAVNIAVLTSGEDSYGVIVDSLLDSEEIVVKPLGRHLKSCPYYAGATILGDGHVAMILDVTAIYGFSMAKQIAEHVEEKTENAGIALPHESHTVLLFRNNNLEHCAIPMVLVTRIEKVPSGSFFMVGPRRAMRYRGDTLIVLALNDCTTVGTMDSYEFYNVIVFSINGHEYGLMVGEVDDIIEIQCDIDGKSYIQPGIMGTFIHENDIHLLVDVYGLAKMLLPDLIVSETIEVIKSEEQTTADRKILLVEDSKFFLHQIENVLKELGYEVLLAEDGAQGLRIYQEHQADIAMVVTDIEMPIMDGLQMTREIRKLHKNSDLPIVVISSLSGDVAEKEGYAAGVTEYLIKMDREQITETCRRLMAR